MPTNSPQNYKIYCSLNNIPIDESIVEDATIDDDDEVEEADNGMDVDMEDDDGDNDNEAENDESGEAPMDEEEDDDMPAFFKELKAADDAKAAAKTPARNPKSKVALIVRAKVNKVLTATKLADKRARQCDQNDFLKLLLGEFLDIPGLGRKMGVNTTEGTMGC
jgi:18S rRNA (adenine1779-N6/adenine1780-N6)-dimethyltransferase